MVNFMSYEFYLKTTKTKTKTAQTGQHPESL